MTKPLVRVCIDCGKTATVKEARQQLWLPEGGGETLH
jgi:hypothetical protein